ncbi:hypothetical protein [Paenibacillus xylanexedens]|uniref:hypothetical protein n=1 Tax=Paenibacillus xylanexedens TaxID=528191 RepID=UPI0011A5FFA4|nr:hypothetical protein [Paenibacillus xylanexedens]
MIKHSSSQKTQLEFQMNRALIRKPDFESDVFNAFVKVQDEVNATPIGGWDLTRWCAAVGARILNFETVQIQGTYLLEFRGLGSYWAIESK